MPRYGAVCDRCATPYLAYTVGAVWLSLCPGCYPQPIGHANTGWAA